MKQIVLVIVLFGAGKHWIKDKMKAELSPAIKMLKRQYFTIAIKEKCQSFSADVMSECFMNFNWN